MKPWNYDGPHYRGSTKHKRRPGNEVKGTFCPEWSHESAAGGLANDPFKHDWHSTPAAKMFEESDPHPDGEERRYATSNGIAFEAKATNDGTWHGYPIPWEAVPTQLVVAWKKARKVRSREVKRYWKDEARIGWALETDQ